MAEEPKADIVERLRKWPPMLANATIYEAADEIERLRAINRILAGTPSQEDIKRGVR